MQRRNLRPPRTYAYCMYADPGCMQQKRSSGEPPSVLIIRLRRKASAVYVLCLYLRPAAGSGSGRRSFLPTTFVIKPRCALVTSVRIADADAATAACSTYVCLSRRPAARTSISIKVSADGQRPADGHLGKTVLPASPPTNQCWLDVP